MKLKEKFAKKMLAEKLDFLPVEESLELFLSDKKIETKFSWVFCNEELEESILKITSIEDLKNLTDTYGTEIIVGKGRNEFAEYTTEVCPAPTYIDLIK